MAADDEADAAGCDAGADAGDCDAAAGDGVAALELQPTTAAAASTIAATVNVLCTGRYLFTDVLSSLSAPDGT
jgi:hypothetical protein